jgi:hypothetical protein
MVEGSGVEERDMSQNSRILSYLQNEGPLTKKQGHEALGIENVGARILDLREMGHEIVTEMIEVTNQYGVSSVAQYSLRKLADQMEMPL